MVRTMIVRYRRFREEASTESSAQSVTSRGPAGIVEHFTKGMAVPVARWLSQRSWVTPNKLTWTSAALGGPLTAFLILSGNTTYASIAYLFSGIIDGLDGDVARLQGRETPEGAILDAVLDRYTDAVVIGAMVLTSPRNLLLPGLFALMGSLLVPYVRAKTEAERKSSTATFGSRDVRNCMIVVGLLANRFFVLLFMLAVFSNASAIHRLVQAIKPDRTAR